MKGQISLDLLLTVLIVLMFIVSTASIANNLRENYENIFLENQLQENADFYSNFITSSQALKGTDFLTKIPLNKIYYKGEHLDPMLSIKTDENYLTISIMSYPKSFNANFIGEGIKVLIIDESFPSELVIQNE